LLLRICREAGTIAPARGPSEPRSRGLFHRGGTGRLPAERPQVVRQGVISPEERRAK
jgi:hypothetical protein